MLRKIVEIDESKCNGCALCVSACHEGAIELIDGKARLINDEYCDGLGDCLPECPTGAIVMVEREAVDYSEKAVEKLKEDKGHRSMPCGCPGSAAKKIDRAINISVKKSERTEAISTEVVSELRQWPVQLNLINTRARYLEGADLLVAADCTAYAYANFHRDFIKGKITVIGCPKLDNIDHYKEKLTEIIKNCDLKSITVVRMEVPCCGGIVNVVKAAMLQSQIIVPYSEVTIGTDGNIIR